MKRFFRFSILTGLLLGFIFLSSSWAHAAKFISRDTYVLSKPARDDLYIAAGEITIDGDVDGDVIIVGGNITINGDVDGDVFVGGGTLVINGDVSRTVRISGGFLTINGQIHRDLLAGGGSVVLSKQSVVSGDVLVGAGDLKSLGKISGKLQASVGSAKISGTVGDDVKLDVQNLTIAEGARIDGDLKYRSNNRASISSKADISGKVTRLKVKKYLPANQQTLQILRFLGWIWSLVSMLTVALLIALIFPKSLTATKVSLKDQPWISLGLGFAGLFLVPIAALMLMFTIIGIPLALIIFALYFISIYLAQLFAATAITSIALDRLGLNWRWIGWASIIGVTLLSVIKLIPYLGGLVGFIVILFGLGGMIYASWSSRQSGESAGA